ncbi:UPF0280 family protein [Limibaculum sp. M0105]|uniref:UPF0280 family protein n=1 Tax=Thermohalobaculum xanthum TaxID=2753746 RepID=A0A8J7SCR4_9RHOB|nr:UPF0280 family protein [Thermohalobaculum xanthum]MBK0399602.1 UPF0280 family protein [Thermohalobaculum xanthum]
MSATARMLPDGRRLHLHHGPIDVIFEAWGSRAEVEAARAQAAARFRSILQELVDELPTLRRPVGDGPSNLSGTVARAMEQAARAHHPTFATPMIAVAGAVADEILRAALSGRRLARAYANNGGDVALHLGPGEAMAAAIATRPELPDRVRIDAASPVRGIATSGWRGRSRSLGIADAVTVLARSAALADAAATLVANAVDLPGHRAVERARACDLDDDSDLGARLVTVAVGHLDPPEAARALEVGAAVARTMKRRGLIEAAALFLAGEARVVGELGTGALIPALERTDG